MTCVWEKVRNSCARSVAAMQNAPASAGAQNQNLPDEHSSGVEDASKHEQCVTVVGDCLYVMMTTVGYHAGALSRGHNCRPIVCAMASGEERRRLPLRVAVLNAFTVPLPRFCFALWWAAEERDSARRPCRPCRCVACTS